MNIFKKKVDMVKPELTPEVAKEIYLYLRDNYLDETEAFCIGGYNPKFCRKVINEVNDILKQAIALIKADPSITAQSVKAGIECTLLDVDKIGVDLIKIFPTRDDTRTFAQFKTNYTE